MTIRYLSNVYHLNDLNSLQSVVLKWKCKQNCFATFLQQGFIEAALIAFTLLKSMKIIISQTSLEILTNIWFKFNLANYSINNIRMRKLKQKPHR